MTIDAAPTSSDQTRVMYVANSEKMGGANRVLTDLIGGLDRSRFAPFLVAPTDGPLVGWARTAGVPWRVVADGDWAGRAGLVRRAARLVPLLVRTRSRIVHAIDPLCYRAAGLAATLTGAARICQLGFPVGPSEIDWSFRWGPDAIVACYEEQAREMSGHLERLGMSRRVVAIPNAVDIHAFVPLANRDDPARERWRRGAKHVVLIVGHLSEVKGYPTFLRAAATIASAVDGCAFLALGGETVSRGYGSSLEQLASDLGIRGRVHFLGWRSEVAQVLQAADVVVLPSLIEGLPMAILEAMACARPVVATAVNGTPEAVVNEVTGLLIPPQDSEALAAAIVRLLENPELARNMGIAGRRRAEEHYSVRRVVSSVQTLYDGLLTRGRAGVVKKHADAGPVASKAITPVPEESAPGNS